MVILSVEGMEEWEFIQRDWAVPVAQSHWHFLLEGQDFLWLMRGGKDR